LRGEIRGLRVLFLSNLGQPGQRALLQRNPDDLRADIVVAGIPGAGEPLTEALLDAIRPRAIVVADSDYPVARKAAAPLKERLALRNIPVFYTSDSQAVTLIVRRGRWELRAMDGTKVDGTIDYGSTNALTRSGFPDTRTGSLTQ
jgi:beta-lactamase superfamily II metal-dependent hydrolase